jgi:hypothetical protein
MDGDRARQISTSPTTSGRINSIAIQPTNPNVIYRRCDRRVWKTTGGGASWTPRNRYPGLAGDGSS